MPFVGKNQPAYVQVGATPDEFGVLSYRSAQDNDHRHYISSRTSWLPYLILWKELNPVSNTAGYFKYISIYQLYQIRLFNANVYRHFLKYYMRNFNEI